jgi:IS1 family transposase
MNQLDSAKRATVIAALVEGNSIRSVVRMTGVAKGTVTRILVEAGAACAEFQDEMLRDLPCRRLQCDEIWSFCYAKDKNVPATKKGDFGVGSVWTWTAIDADTKLIASWMVGSRDANAASAFMGDLSSRLRYRVQLTTDGHKPYLEAVEDAFGGNIDYAMLIKIYGDANTDEKRYSPAECTGIKIQPVVGNPNPKHISTSYVERQNLTMRMHMRRFTRLTNGFSKKVENHIAAISLHFMYYNFVKNHLTIRMTPAMAAGVTKQPMTIMDIVRLMESREARVSAETKAELVERAFSPKGPALGHGR